MRITTVLLASASVLAICLAGCTGQEKLLPENSIETVASPWEGYDPFAPEIETIPLKSALSTAVGISENGFNVVALDQLNQVDYSVQNALILDSTSKSLVVSLKQSMPFVGLYITYDSSSMHTTGMVTDRPDGISIAVEPEPGLIAIGVHVLGDGSLDPSFPVVSISFEDGASSVQKSLLDISLVDAFPVDDLEALDSGEETATLGWSEANSGDYDLNGEVNLSDLAKIAISFREAYTPSSPNFAQLEVIDGDRNGEVNLADITPIAVNFRSSVTGYNVYRMPIATIDDDPTPNDSGWELIPNISDPSEPTVVRINNGQNFRYTYTFLDASGIGIFAWYVVPVGPLGTPREEGKPSNVGKVVVTPGTPPEAGLSFEIMLPNGPLMNLNDEFYIGIKIADVEGLFSANVRFEYDGSLVELVEAISTYDTNVNLLEPPLFIAADDVPPGADSPYILLGFNSTQTQGTAVKDGTGFIGYFKFKVIDANTNLEAFRFPVASNFMLLWGEQYGVPIATPVLGSPQVINAG